jgi:hypothetical protein
MKNITPLRILLSTLLLGSQAFAYSPILRDFHSVRTAGMGDIRYTVGEYEENFFANPARSTDNPGFLLQLPKISLETSSGTISSIGNLLKSGNGLQAFQDSVGKPLSARVQFIPFAIHFKNFITEKWSLGLGAFLSAQTIPVISNSGAIDPNTLISAGPVINLSRRLMDEDRLSVGMNFRTEVRASSNSSKQFSIQDFLAGTNTADFVQGGSGMGFDFDLGSTFRPHWKNFGFEYQIAFAINNVLGGQYKNLGKPIKSWSSDPFVTKRSYNFGLSGRKKGLLGMDEVILALESTDIGNNTDGSFFRTLHMGAEADWSIFRIRGGLNQGYLTAGFGIDLYLFSLNLATYGEELGLNAGVKQDRRYALELSFKI